MMNKCTYTYEYFIFYMIKGKNKSGFANAFISLDKRIENKEDIKEIENKIINEGKHKECHIINFTYIVTKVNMQKQGTKKK